MPTKIHCDLNGGIGLRTIKWWCQMMRQSGSIKLSGPADDPCFSRTKGNIQKVEHHLRQKKRVLAEDRSMKRWCFRQKCLANNEKRLGLRPHKIVIEPLLSNDQKIK